MAAKYKIEFTKSSIKDIQKLDRQIAKRIKKKIEYFVESGNPLQYAANLTKSSDAQYRWRVGDYRILFDEKDKVITVLHIQHRREVYKK